MYPDQVWLDTHEPELTAAEYEAAAAYHDAGSDGRREAWRSLAGQFGTPRAAWLVEWATAHDFTQPPPPLRVASWSRATRLHGLPTAFHIFAYRGNNLIHHANSKRVREDATVLASPRSRVSLRLSGAAGTRIPTGSIVVHDPTGVTWALTTEVTIGTDGTAEADAESLTPTPVVAASTAWTVDGEVAGWVGAESIGDSSTTEGLFDTRSRWMVDLQAALDDGFAVEIPLTATDLAEGFDRIVAVGIRWSSASAGQATVEDLVRSHAYTDDLSFVAPDTPTNNTEEVRSGATGAIDLERAYDTRVTGPANWEAQSSGDRRTNGHRLARALGIDAEVLRRVDGAGSTGESYAAEVNTVVWPVTGDYYLRHLLPGVLDEGELAALAAHHALYVRGAGPLPTLRIGQQPYGVLPATHAWRPSRHDVHPSPTFDARIYGTVAGLLARWLVLARNGRRVPRVTPGDPDPDQTLLQVLAMEPRSLTYHARPFVDDRFIAWLLVTLKDYAFGSGTPYESLGLQPADAIALWAAAWDQAQERVVTLLHDVTGGDPATFRQQPLMRMLAWLDGREVPLGVSIDPDRPEWLPAHQLTALCAGTAEPATTLITDIIQRAAAQTIGAAKAAVRDAVCRLADAGPLDFLNSVTTAQQIVDRIKDDPLVHPERVGYGVRMRLAERILARRAELGGFTSLAQVDAIRGVGEDTLHDIIYSFQSAEARGDVDRMLRESLDLASHRVDAWVTSFATKRLASLRAGPDASAGVHVGAYGFVESVRPRAAGLSEGYLHAPSSAHAATAAVLFNAFLTHDPTVARDPQDPTTGNPFRINLTSGRVRCGLRLLEGVRQGQPLAALLGYQVERAMQDRDLVLTQYVDELRALFPIVAHKIPETAGAEPAETVSARNVVDGTALVRAYRDERQHLPGPLASFLQGLPAGHASALSDVFALADASLDAVSDLLTAESVHQVVQGNFDRAAAALDAAAGNQSPPELEIVDTPGAGPAYTHRVCTLFNAVKPFADGPARAADPRAAAEPRLAAWWEALLGPIAEIGVGIDFLELETDEGILARTNVNTADVAALAALPGIGPALAGAIVAERTGPGGAFRQLDELARVAGIGQTIVSGLRTEATTGYRERVDLNTASTERLETLPGIDAGLAAAIVTERSITPFGDVGALARVTGIDAALVDQLRSHVVAWLLDVNRATAEQLEGLPVIGAVLAARIVAARTDGPFDGLTDLLRVEGITDGMLAQLADWITTDRAVRGLGGTGLSAVDFLYTAQATPGAGETDLDQHVARIVRAEFGLPATQRVDVHPARHGRFTRSLANAVELAQQALRFLAAGRPMSPGTSRHPGDDAGDGYSDLDVVALRGRVEAAQTLVRADDGATGLLDRCDAAMVASTVTLRFAGAPQLLVPAGTPACHLPSGTVWTTDADVTLGADGVGDAAATSRDPRAPIAIPASDHWSPEMFLAGLTSVASVTASAPNDPDAIMTLLEQMARFGVPGAMPRGTDDSGLDERFGGARTALRKRLAASQDLVAQVDALGAGAPGKAMRLLLNAMRALFGESFVVLPTFVPAAGGDLASALIQDILNGLGDARVRFWVQQAGEVRPAVSELENTMLFAESWTQSTRLNAPPPLALRVAQLPFTAGRPWIGLSDAERGSIQPRPDWSRSPLSLVLAAHGPMPTFADDSGDAYRVVTAGLVLDEWNERIPESEQRTSVAFHYDAPNAQAPQVVLLAVPGHVAPTPTLWTPQELAAIVNDTVDLAQARAVDLDALVDEAAAPVGTEPEPLGAVLPGIYLPADPAHPGWARDLAGQTIEEWLDALVPDVPIVVDERINMYGDVTANGSVWETAGGVVIGASDGSVLGHGLFSDNPSDSGTVLWSDAGIRIDFPHDMPRVVLYVGWPGDPDIVVRDHTGSESGHVLFTEWPALKTIELGSTTIGTFRMFEYTVVGAGVRQIELRGRSLLNYIATYRPA